jgi:hypothetical protein
LTYIHIYAIFLSLIFFTIYCIKDVDECVYGEKVTGMKGNIKNVEWLLCVHAIH